MAEIPNLAGVASKDLVESIGSGKFSAAYINWARTINLLHEHAPGWTVYYVPNSNGGLIHQAPVGAYLLIGFRHIDGTSTPAVPQAVMNNRNQSIELEKITSRDITDTQRRGMCMAAAMTFGLAYELWAKMPMESGYHSDAQELELQQDTSKFQSQGGTKDPAPAATAEAVKASKKDFVDFAKKLGLIEPAVKDLIGKIGGDFLVGIKTLQSKDSEWILEMNEKFRVSQY